MGTCDLRIQCDDGFNSPRHITTFHSARHLTKEAASDDVYSQWTSSTHHPNPCNFPEREKLHYTYHDDFSDLDGRNVHIRIWNGHYVSPNNGDPSGHGATGAGWRLHTVPHHGPDGNDHELFTLESADAVTSDLYVIRTWNDQYVAQNTKDPSPPGSRLHTVRQRTDANSFTLVGLGKTTTFDTDSFRQIDYEVHEAYYIKLDGWYVSPHDGDPSTGSPPGSGWRLHTVPTHGPPRNDRERFTLSIVK